MVVDPVCGMSIPAETAARSCEHAGHTYYFCSPSCHSRFLANPDAFVGKPAPRRTTATLPAGRDRQPLFRAAQWGIVAAVALLVIYFGLVTLVSGYEFMLDQFSQFWPFIVALTTGFGVQVGLYTYLRSAVHRMHGAGKVVAVSGTTSGAAMVSCCTHYLVNLLPALGATGLVTLVGQYQVELFWFGLAANAAGILYVGSRLVQFNKEA